MLTRLARTPPTRYPASHCYHSPLHAGKLLHSRTDAVWPISVVSWDLSGLAKASRLREADVVRGDTLNHAAALPSHRHFVSFREFRGGMLAYLSHRVEKVKHARLGTRETQNLRYPRSCQVRCHAIFRFSVAAVSWVYLVDEAEAGESTAEGKHPGLQWN